MHIGGKNYGPLSTKDISAFLKKKEMSISNFVFKIKEKAWFMIGDLDEFSEYLPKRPLIPVEPFNIYLILENKIVGPFTKSVILKKLKDNEINFFNFIYVEGQKDWVRIKESSSFNSEINLPPSIVPNFPVNPPGKIKNQTEEPKEDLLQIAESPGQGNNLANEILEEQKKDLLPIEKRKKGPGLNNCFEIGNEPIWIIEKGDENLGPFRYLEILKMIQRNVITKNNKIKKTDDAGWNKVSDHFEFNTKLIKQIVTEGGEKVEKIFLTRQHKRSSYLAPAKIQAKGKIYSGMCSSISVGGCFIEIRPDEFELNKEVIIKIMSGSIPTIIESKGIVISINERNPRGVGFRFLGLGLDEATEIQKFINKHADK